MMSSIKYDGWLSQIPFTKNDGSSHVAWERRADLLTLLQVPTIIVELIVGQTKDLLVLGLIFYRPCYPSSRGRHEASKKSAISLVGTSAPGEAPGRKVLLL